jgi:hypothetical protein
MKTGKEVGRFKEKRKRVCLRVPNYLNSSFIFIFGVRIFTGCLTIKHPKSMIAHNYPGLEPTL